MLAAAELPQAELSQTETESPPIRALPYPPPASRDPAARKRGNKTLIEESKRHRLKQAVSLTQSIMESAQEMREQVSQPACEKEDAESAMIRKRAAAGILARLAMSWRTVASGIAELKGEPTPGQKRPIPDELKVPKARKSNAPPDPV